MEQDKIIKLSVVAVLSIVLFSAFMVPIISNLDYERTTYDNDFVLKDVYRIDKGFVDMELDFYSGYFEGTIDGIPVSFPLKARENFVLVSDKATFIQTFTGSTNPAKSVYGWFFNEVGTNTTYIGQNEFNGSHISIDAETKELTYTKGDIKYSAVLDWVYHISVDGPYRTFQTDRNWYANPDNLTVAGGGYYETGNNDTTYSYYSFNNSEFITSGQYEGEIKLTREQINDNVDKCSVLIDIGGEEFKPWNVIIPVKVTSGQFTNEQTLIEIIPLLAILGIVSALVFAIFKRRADY